VYAYVIVEIVTNHQQVLGSYALTWTKCWMRI